MDIPNRVSVYLNENTHPTFVDNFKAAWVHLDEPTINAIVEAAEDPDFDIRPVKMLMMTVSIEHMVETINSYGIVTQNMGLNLCTAVLDAIRSIERYETDIDELERILSHPSLDEGVAFIVDSSSHNAIYDSLLERIITVKDEFGVWVEEMIMEYNNREASEMIRKDNIVNVVRAIMKDSIGEFLLSTMNVEVGLSCVSYINGAVGMGDGVRREIIQHPNIEGHIASLLILSKTDEEDWLSEAKESLKLLNHYHEEAGNEGFDEVRIVKIAADAVKLLTRNTDD